MTGARILIVEDEAILAEELSTRINRMGLAVAGIAACADDAMARAADSAPDLVLMDIRLQGATDGVDAALAIRDRFDLPVVFVTAHSDGTTVGRAKLAGPFGYVIKPFNQQELSVAIEMALHKHAADRHEHQLLETQRTESLGRVAGSVAHDFSNLLVPIIGNANLAALEVDPQSRAAVYLERINEAAERAAVLCRQMLAYSGRGHLQIEASSVNAIIENMQELLRAPAKKRVALTFCLGPGLPDIAVDANQIQQLLMNLVLNAVEAVGDADGSIVVRTRSERVLEDAVSAAGPLTPGSYVVIEVADSGAGIELDATERIFEPFFTTKAFGRGLGLAAARGIARGHRGAIGVDSMPGHGATFFVYLPANTATTAPHPIANL
jgi:signal transduction histidine kinase